MAGVAVVLDTFGVQVGITEDQIVDTLVKLAEAGGALYALWGLRMAKTEIK